MHRAIEASALSAVFGAPRDPMTAIEARAAQLLPPGAIVWEGDPATFEFSYVSKAAEALLGHPVSRWTGEPTFWADVVVHPADRDDAVAYCALATGRCRDHEFEYRAVASDGSIVWLRDFVRVLLSPRGVPERLRGIMIDISAQKRAAGTFDLPPGGEVPARETLRAS